MAKRVSKKAQDVRVGFLLKESFATIGRNWRTLGGVWLAVTAVGAALMTVLYSGNDWAESKMLDVAELAVMVVMWLMTLYTVRRILAGQKVSVRETIFSAMGPLFGMIIVGAVVAVCCLPLGALVIAYVAAVEVSLFANLGWAVVFLIFAAVMLVLSGFLLASTLLALVAVSAPGIYPITAITETFKLMRGRRVKFILKLLILEIMLGVVEAVLMLVMVHLPTPAAVVGKVIVGNLITMYSAIYLYIYYKEILG